jgi:hypothetical protein
MAYTGRFLNYWDSKMMKVKDFDKWVRRQVLLYLQNEQSNRRGVSWTSHAARLHFRGRVPQLKPSTISLIVSARLWSLIKELVKAESLNLEQKELLCDTQEGRKIVDDIAKDEFPDLMPKLRKVMDTFEGYPDQRIFNRMLEIDPSLTCYETDNKCIVECQAESDKLSAEGFVRLVSRHPDAVNHARYRLADHIEKGRIGLTFLKNAPVKEEDKDEE